MLCGSILGVGDVTGSVFVFLFSVFFPCAWVGPVDLLLRDLIVCRCRPVGGGPPYFNVNAGSLTIKKKKKKNSRVIIRLVKYT